MEGAAMLLRYKQHHPKQPADFVHDAEISQERAASLPVGHPEKAELEAIARYALFVATIMIQRCVCQARTIH
jgi:hypothetical protein